MPRGLRASIRILVTAAIIATTFACLHLTSVLPLAGPRFSSSAGLKFRPLEVVEPNAPACQLLANPDDVVVIMRTGASEIAAKLPVHLNTTIKCYPDTLIFSDWAEVFQGHHVYDALLNVDHHLKETNYDFAHYMRLQMLGREGLSKEETQATTYESGPVGKNDNPGWRLDKWKFLPMVVRALELRPQAKWFVFVEPDTYLVWSNMLQWLPTLDPSEASYHGSEVQIGEDIFAHGGSAFLLSRPAMQRVANLYISEPEEWHDRTAHHWAGDCILGTALAHAGVPFTWAWPMFQGGNPADMDWTEAKDERKLWCAPALSYHHFEPHEIESMWTFEQHRISALAVEPPKKSFFGGRDTVLHHSDVFKQRVMPNISQVRDGWTNASPDLVEHSARIVKPAEARLEECQAICEAKGTCLQYAVSPIGCSTSDQVKLGRVSQGVRSDWMMPRVERWVKNMDRCPRSSTRWVVW
ncbi:hypothetical protein LTR56_021426 [Elasticomyces elasticus]|nr:hypothetical protein LTR56_021426 [Elasticomyces elasticus]